MLRYDTHTQRERERAHVDRSGSRLVRADATIVIQQQIVAIISHYRFNTVTSVLIERLGKSLDKISEAAACASASRLIALNV
jgi:hypothetical protein